VLDLRRLRSEPDAVRAALQRRGDPGLSEALDRVLELDESRRALLPQLEELRARRLPMPNPNG
jgi:seryl-tRNA synthetase